MNATPATDAALRDAVIKEFEWCAELDPSHIIVGAQDSVVELAGHVPSLAQVDSATRAAFRVTGVTAVANDIAVHLPTRSTKPDRAIAVAVRDAIRWNTMVPQNRVTVAVTDHVVTLAGEVDYNFQRQEAERIATHTIGVRRVDNRVSLPHHPVPADAAERIREAFQRNALLDADGITVSVSGSEVILRGTVYSSAEKADAGRAAWSTPYVTEVVNLIEVKAAR
jgi:osmotically-inducible protein OsmY